MTSLSSALVAGSSLLSQQTNDDTKTAIQALMNPNNKNEDQKDSSDTDTNEKRAWAFVEQIVNVHKSIRNSPQANLYIEPISVNEMYELTMNFLNCQNKYSTLGYPIDVTLGYCYTSEECIENIMFDGLMSTTSSTAVEAVVKNNSWPGIHVGTNVFACHEKNSIGVMVAMLKGRSQKITDFNWPNCPHGSSIPNEEYSSSVLHDDTLFFNELKFGQRIILKNSFQCIPIIQFDPCLLEPPKCTQKKKLWQQFGGEHIWTYHEQVQQVVDSTFNQRSTQIN